MVEHLENRNVLSPLMAATEGAWAKSGGPYVRFDSASPGVTSSSTLPPDPSFVVDDVATLPTTGQLLVSGGNETVFRGMHYRPTTELDTVNPATGVRTHVLDVTPAFLFGNAPGFVPQGNILTALAADPATDLVRITYRFTGPNVIPPPPWDAAGFRERPRGPPNLGRGGTRPRSGLHRGRSEFRARYP
jgi:hypothetical protein